MVKLYLITLIMERKIIMIPVNEKIKVELGDLVIVNTGSLLGKVAYRVIDDPLHIKLENIENGNEYQKLFKSLNELQGYIEMHSHVFKLISMR